MHSVSNYYSHSSYAPGNLLATLNVPPKLTAPTKSTTKYRQKWHVVILVTMTLPISRTAMRVCQTMSPRYLLHPLAQGLPLAFEQPVKNLPQMRHVNHRREVLVSWTRLPNLSIPHTRPNATRSERQCCYNLNSYSYCKPRSGT